MNIPNPNQILILSVSGPLKTDLIRTGSGDSTPLVRRWYREGIRQGIQRLKDVSPAYVYLQVDEMKKDNS